MVGAAVSRAYPHVPHTHRIEILIFTGSMAASFLICEFLETWPLGKAGLMPGECVRETATPTGPLAQMPMWICLTSGSVKGLTSLDMPFVEMGVFKCVQTQHKGRRVGSAIV